MPRLLALLCVPLMIRGIIAADHVDLANAVVVAPATANDQSLLIAPTVLVEEIAKRTGVQWKTVPSIPNHASAIVVARSSDLQSLTFPVPAVVTEAAGKLRPEGFTVQSVKIGEHTVVWVAGAGPRGTLFGVGHLLRQLDQRKNFVKLPAPISIVTSPAYPLRGHQLGYRNRANSYDAWDAKQYEQYIRELALFGANAIESIPFKDAQPTPHLKVSREEMTRAISDICRRYDLQHWAWTPAEVDLSNADLRSRALQEHEQLYANCLRLDGVFVPGGDPGENPPELVMPFLKDLGDRLRSRHSKAKVWVSMQGFDPQQTNFVHDWIQQHRPDWLGGLVHGPSSPDLAETRRRLPSEFAIRHYPDITHAVRCQYPIPWWDPALAATETREPVLTIPSYHATIHNAFAPWTNGFLSYSDGIHDDISKVLWTRLAWNPGSEVRDILLDYCRFHFGVDEAATAADGILSLERNWQGAVSTNGGIDATLALWQQLDARHPHPGNWRWEMLLLRANLDAFVRHRLLAESKLEAEANAALADTGSQGTQHAMDSALRILKQAESEQARPDLRSRITELCESLFQSIGFQTSVTRHQAASPDRAAVLDFLDYPLNNRWWLEDQFAEIRQLTDEAERRKRLDVIRTWEHPGPGCFYDDVGNVAKNPHVIRGEAPETDPRLLRNPNPNYWEGGRKRSRQSWYSIMDWPLGLRYAGLDAAAGYVVRTTGFGQCLLRADGQRLTPSIDDREIGEFKEFPVPPDLSADGVLILTFDAPDEAHINWRQQSRLTEVWLIRSSADSVRQ